MPLATGHAALSSPKDEAAQAAKPKVIADPPMTQRGSRTVSHRLGFFSISQP